MRQFLLPLAKNCAVHLTQNILQIIARKVTGKAGSVILSHGLCWHDTSMNCSDKPRVSILANYTPKFVRPMMDVFSNMPSKFIDDASPKLKRLLGYEFKSDFFKDVKRIREEWSN